MNFGFRKNAVPLKQTDIFVFNVVRQAVHGAAQIQQSAFFRFIHPFRCIVVSIENDAFVVMNRIFYNLVQRAFKIVGFFQFVGKLPQFICNSGVQHHIWAGKRRGRSNHAEFKLVASEGERGSAVAVGCVFGEAGKNIAADFHKHFVFLHIRLSAFNGFQNVGQFVAQKHGYNSRRRFICAQTVVIARACHGNAEKILVFVHCLDHGSQEQEKLGILPGGIAGFQKIFSSIR